MLCPFQVWYLSIIMQYPLYGTTLYPVKCRGFLTYDHQMLLGISAEGVLLVNAETKSILNAYRYNELESVRVASDEDSITFTLPKDVPGEYTESFAQIASAPKSELWTPCSIHAFLS